MARAWSASSRSATHCFASSPAARDPRTTPVGQVMTRDPQTIHPDKPFEEALRLMYEGRFRHVPVVEDGRPLGIVSVREAIHPDFIELAQVLETREVARE